MAYHDSPALWKPLLLTGLQDDCAQWDWTALSSKPDRVLGAKIIAKSDGIWAADGLLETLADVAREQFGAKSFTVKSKTSNGSRLKKGAVVCEWRGPARAVLALERPFINLASYVGGIATSTRALVDVVQARCPRGTPRVSPTRKILPAYRDLAIHGVLVGGGHSHRTTLSGGVLIKENHVASAGSIARAIQNAREIAPHGLKIEIEVRNTRELKQAVQAGAEVIMLDNFTVTEARAAVALVKDLKPRPVLEISGGLTVDTISDYAISGVDVLSVGSITHSVRALDLSLLVDGT